jgi:GxxExxY protein
MLCFGAVHGRTGPASVVLWRHHTMDDYPEASLTRRIIGAAIDVHRLVGPGMFESAYDVCFRHRLTQLGILFERQVPIPITYDGVYLDCGYRADLIVEDRVVVEVKAVAELLPLHSAQLLTYLKFSGKPVGLLINFNVEILKDGIIRKVR